MDIFIDDRGSCAICLLGHGSRDSEANREFLNLSNKLRKKNICKTIEWGFLEFAKPTAIEALSACQRNGIKDIIILSGILFPGKHTQSDVPNIVDEVFRGHPEINIIFAAPLGTQPKLIEACEKLIEEGEKISSKSISRSETLLLAFGHGSRNRDFNTQVENNLSKLGERIGFGKTLVFFVGSSKNFLEDMSDSFTPQGFRRVILLPFFLFTGVWVKRINDLADTFQKKYLNTEFLMASCLSHHDLTVDALIQRVRESVYKE
jgi:precorrin-8X/cobalt-precorrin-8 methylmutase